MSVLPWIHELPWALYVSYKEGDLGVCHRFKTYEELDKVFYEITDKPHKVMYINILENNDFENSMYMIIKPPKKIKIVKRKKKNKN